MGVINFFRNIFYKFKKEPTTITLIGLYLLSCLLIFIWISIDTYFSPFKNITTDTFIYMALSGGIGATLSAMTAFSRHNARSDFRLSYIWWYIFRPIGGLIMGVVIYLFVVTNLIVLSVAPSSIDVRSILFYSAISFLGGFAFEQVAIKFNELASTLFAKKPKKEEQVMGEYRKRKDNNTWHWCKNCSNYPISNYTSRATKPKSGEFCIECKCRSKIEIEGN